MDDDELYEDTVESATPAPLTFADVLQVPVAAVAGFSQGLAEGLKIFYDALTMHSAWVYQRKASKRSRESFAQDAGVQIAALTKDVK